MFDFKRRRKKEREIRSGGVCCRKVEAANRPVLRQNSLVSFSRKSESDKKPRLISKLAVIGLERQSNSNRSFIFLEQRAKSTGSQ